MFTRKSLGLNCSVGLCCITILLHTCFLINAMSLQI
uniref:Uncharacterized protein n=1 Tax=Rhizophora mucronata TaxID=61149 RepID=A0A2P2PV69_RHIMU